jgi:DNA-binding SARP family transcriptional activator
MLGGFQVLCRGESIDLREGGKAEVLLASLALRPDVPVSRETLVEAIWPEVDAALASQSLKSLIYSLHKLCSNALSGQSPVLHSGGGYQLNGPAGVQVDTVVFEALAADADARTRSGEGDAAARLSEAAVVLYRGDLDAGSSLEALIARERLRALYLRLLALLADHAFQGQRFAEALDAALKLLQHDPCREDAHRLAMRCYVRRGERAQALRQFQLCEAVLQSAFSARPESATRRLFDQIRLDPDSI